MRVASYLCRGVREDLGLTAQQRFQTLYQVYLAKDQIHSPMLAYALAYRVAIQTVSLGMFAEGIKVTGFMLEIAEANDLATLYTEAYRQRAFLQAELGQFDAALLSNDAALHYAETHPIRLGLLTNRGYLLTMAKRYDQALAVYEEILAQVDGPTRAQYEIWIGTNVAYIHTEANKVAENLTLTSRLVELAEQHENAEDRAFTYIARAFALLQAGEYDKAQPMFDHYNQWFLDNNFDVRTAENRERWAALLFEQGRFQQAYEYLHSSVRLYQQIEKNRGNPELSLVTAVLEAEQSHRELLAADQRLHLAEQKRKSQMHVLLLGLGASLLILVICVYAYARLRQFNAKLDATNIKLAYESNHDPLTGAFNRRYFTAFIQANHIDLAKVPAVIALLDVDFFKKLNDTYGHDVGDEVLKRVVKRLRNATKATDLVVRWGGEEFLLYMPVSEPLDSCRQIIERVLTEVNSQPFQVNTLQLKVTVSIGFKLLVTTLPIEQEIKQVDNYLYMAKRQGRCRAIGNARTDMIEPETVISST